MRRSYLKEGAVQLTALDSLLTHSRYLFLFSDLLLVAKQKAANSYKLKEKVRLDRIWIASNNCPHSFLIGWPISNFIAHFSTEEEKTKWQTVLNEGIERGRAKMQPKFTTLPVLVRIDGRNQAICGWRDLERKLYRFLSASVNLLQVIKKKIGIEQRSSEILVELINELAIPQSEELELVFDAGGGDAEVVLQGPENVFCVVMEHVKGSGCRLSEVQFERLDTFPLVQCRLIVSTVAASRSNPAHSFVTQFKRVLSRSESKRFFGRNLEGSAPPQPVLTMIDHLILHGVDVEGIFRKSPKQSTVRMLKAQLDRGSVPDFSQFSAHVTAALLKEYLRAIPGKLLLSGNYELWASALEQRDERERRAIIRRLLQMLPSSHTVLLSSFLRLMRAISNSAHSKMNAQSLAVCIAPSLIDSPKMECSALVLPSLVEYLIINAPFLLDPFHDAQLAISSSISNDSGLSDVDGGLEPSVSPDSSVLASPTSGCSFTTSPGKASQLSSSAYVRCNHYSLRAPSSAYYVSSISTDEDEDVSTEIEKEDNDRTPVLSRENSNVQHRPSQIAGWKSVSKECYIIKNSAQGETRRHETSASTLKRRETVGSCRATTVGPQIAPQIRSNIRHETNVSMASSSCKDRRPLGIASSMRNGSPITMRKEFTSSCATANTGESTVSGVAIVRSGIARSSPALLCRDELPQSVYQDMPSSMTLRKETMSMTEGSPSIVRKASTMSTTPSVHSDASFASPTPCRKDSGSMVGGDGRSSEGNQRFKNASCVNDGASRSNVLRLRHTSEDNNETLRGRTENRVQMPLISSAPTPYSSYRQEAATNPHRWGIKKHFSGSGFDPTSAVGHMERDILGDSSEHSFNPPCNNIISLQEKEKRSVVQPRRDSSTAVQSRSGDVKDSGPTYSSYQSDNEETRAAGILRQRCVASSCFERRIMEVQPHQKLQSSEGVVSEGEIARGGARFVEVKPILRDAVRQRMQGLPSTADIDFSRSLSKNGVNLTWEQQRQCNNIAARRERKKNRSILMEPLEVNWSVDELRSIFQTESGPPALDTEYRSSNITFH
uniref:Rho-GAP domain-containing protein n=1 Tax=Ascaris lumbricoides TaxID=6252 RepID=A0A0M3HSA4_ASCLU